MTSSPAAATLPDYPDALARALESVRADDGAEGPPRLETIAFEEAIGRTLRAPVVADRDLPPFDRAQMDGYALRHAELAELSAWTIARKIAAGQPEGGPVPPGSCVAIATGAPVPEDVDTVVQHELSDRGDPVRFDGAAVRTIGRGHAVHPRAADARAGDVLIEPATILSAHHLGIAAAVGATTLTVAARPRAVVLTSGDEVLPPGDHVQTHQIRNSNAPQTLSLLRRMGAEALGSRHVLDERDETVEAVGAALASCDLVITIGGVSAGERDHFPAAFDAHEVERFLVGAAIQPGKPVVVGRAPNGAVVVGLPGNPVSSLACACLFVWPIVRAMTGAPTDLPWRRAELAARVRANPRRRAFRPGRFGPDGRVTVPAWAGSGDLAHTAVTDGLVELPVQTEPVEAGTVVRVLEWP